MKEKGKHNIRRWVSGYLVLVMMLTFLFDHPFVSLSYANLSGGTGGAAASASDAIRNGKVSLKNQPGQDIQITVVSDHAGYDPGDTICLDLYITNHTDQELTEGLLKYRGKGILEDSTYFEDLSDLYQAGTKEKEETTAAEPGDGEGEREESGEWNPEAAGTDDKDLDQMDSDENEEWETASDSDADREEYPDRLTNLTIAPGESYFVNFYYTIDDEIQGIKNQNIEFTLRGVLEDKTVTVRETFRYSIGAMNLLPVEIGRDGQVAYGEKGEMLLDFDLGDLEDMILEAEMEANADDDEASPSNGKKASSSQAKIASSSQIRTASSSQIKPASSSNAWIKWEGDLAGIPNTSKERPLVKNLKCQVETYGIKLNHFRLAEEETDKEEDEYGTSAVCQFTVDPDTEPGVYHGKVTATYQFKNRKFQSTQGFSVTVTEPEDALIAEIIDLIDQLPEMEEAASILESFDEAGDDEGYDGYLTELSRQVIDVYVRYEDLENDLKEKVTNRDKLLQYEWIWSAMLLENTVSEVTVKQINKYESAVPTLVYGKSVGAISNMNYTYWDVIVVEKDATGRLYVSKYVTEDVSKREYKADTPDGFVLLLHDQKADAKVNDTVLVNFDYKNKTGVNTNGFGTISFTSVNLGKPKPEKQNKLHIVEGADTRDIITLNLYNYGNDINDLYRINNQYPGFQQDNGTSHVYSTTSSNFGNNITADLNAGLTGITNKGGEINKTNTEGINKPIKGAMKSTLGDDGYPALENGTSLEYLFSDDKKQNEDSINGLFQYNDVTGEYTFNSRENHAQFNDGDDTFTLYREIISSNFIMYPFGNFLPFNDIVKASTQSSTIDRDYFIMIADSALYKYANNGQGEEYSTLAGVLKSWVEKMDKKYPNGWRAAQAANEYFNSFVGDKNFDFSQEQKLLEKVYTIDYDEPTDFFFGMEMKMNFMQPKGGLTGKDGQQPMRFYFTGDDDVWVYVDGKLFLDLSGIHRHVGGEIDFVNGLVKYYALDPKTGDVSNNPYEQKTFRELVANQSLLNEKGTFKDYSTHSFNFYYMERGAGSGVCRLNFNFPLLRQNSISVKKDLSVDEADKLSLLGNPDFRFQILKENGEELFIGKNTDYHIYNENNENIGIGTTDANGVFTIKANQMAVFGDIDENSGRYFVRELLNPEEFSQYGTITVDGSSTTTKYDVTVGEDSFKGVNSPVKDASDGSTIFSFNNQITFKKLGSLEISKKLNAYEAIPPEPEFRFQVRLDDKRLPVGTAYTVQKASGAEAVLEGAPVSQAAEARTVSEEGIIILKAGETARISNIIAGSRFTVTEESASSEGYHVTYQVDDGEPGGQPASGVIKTEARVSVLVTNTQKGGTSVDIPITKLLEQADGAEHTYSFTLVQVKGAENEDSVENGTQQTITVTIPPAVSGDGAGTESSISTNTGNFSLTYLEREMTSSQETYYYLITEKADPDPGVLTKFDDAVYLAEVTVVKTGDGIQASVKKYQKSKEDGKLWEEVNDSVSFTNRLLQGYELPETGGMGTMRYTFSGIAWMAIVLMYDMLRRRRKL